MHVGVSIGLWSSRQNRVYVWFIVKFNPALKLSLSLWSLEEDIIFTNLWNRNKNRYLVILLWKLHKMYVTYAWTVQAFKKVFLWVIIVLLFWQYKSFLLKVHLSIWFYFYNQIQRNYLNITSQYLLSLYITHFYIFLLQLSFIIAKRNTHKDNTFKKYNW